MKIFSLWFIVKAAGIMVILSVITVSSAYATLGFEPWEDEVFVAIGKDYGPEAEKRFRWIMEIVIANHDKPIMEKLKLTNNTLNNIPWIADSDLWKNEDYWATPFETLATFGGDCEDIAFAKYGMLLLMGVPDDTMGFAYVETREKERHMVLIYRENDSFPVYVLDNQAAEVYIGAERRDLTAIYVFQGDGRLYIIGDDGKKRYIKQEFAGQRFEKWITGKDRARKNRKEYEKYNGGRPLFPDN
jgi:predicted transglutaminase-like cysteine proteinase